jgi:hypothetical protein
MLAAIFLSFGAALLTMLLALVASLLISYGLGIGELGAALSFYIAAPLAGMWIFIVAFRNLRP